MILQQDMISHKKGVAFAPAPFQDYRISESRRIVRINFKPIQLEKAPSSKSIADFGKEIFSLTQEKYEL